MKVCIVSSGNFFSNYGGGQVYVRNIVDELIRHKEITINVISFDRSQKHSNREYNGIIVHQVNDGSTLLNALKTIKPNIVHANGEKLLTSRICKQLNIPCIITVHHGGLVCPAGTLLNTDDEICNIPANYSHCLKCYLRNTRTGLLWYPLLKKYSQQRYIKIGKRLKSIHFIPFLTPIGETGLIVNEKLAEWRELLKTATHFIAPSNAIAEALVRNGCSESKITVIPHGIPTLSEVNVKAKVNVDKIKFYYVGRINYVKGIHILLKSFTVIDNQNIELHLIGGAGNKTEQRYMKRLQKRYYKDKRIVWHGKLPFEYINELTKGFHCLIHPAIYLEVFGLTISEALAQHKYVISTRCGGAEMQIHSKSDGLLISPNNIQELRNAICTYIDNPIQSDTNVISIQQHVSNLIDTYNTFIY